MLYSQMILVQRQPILWIPAKSLVANADIKVATCKYFSKLVHWKISKSSAAILQRVFFFTRNMNHGCRSCECYYIEEVWQDHYVIRSHILVLNIATTHIRKTFKPLTSWAMMKAVTSRRPGLSVNDQPLDRVTNINAWLMVLTWR